MNRYDHHGPKKKNSYLKDSSYDEAQMERRKMIQSKLNDAIRDDNDDDDVLGQILSSSKRDSRLSGGSNKERKQQQQRGRSTTSRIECDDVLKESKNNVEQLLSTQHNQSEREYEERLTMARRKSRGRVRRDKDILIKPPTPTTQPSSQQEPSTVESSLMSFGRSLSPHSLLRKTRQQRVSTNSNGNDDGSSNNNSRRINTTSNNSYNNEESSSLDLSSSITSFLTRTRSPSPHALRRGSRTTFRTPRRTKSSEVNSNNSMDRTAQISPQPPRRIKSMHEKIRIPKYNADNGAGNDDSSYRSNNTIETSSLTSFHSSNLLSGESNHSMISAGSSINSSNRSREDIYNSAVLRAKQRQKQKNLDRYHHHHPENNSLSAFMASSSSNYFPNHSDVEDDDDEEEKSIFSSILQKVEKIYDDCS